MPIENNKPPDPILEELSTLTGMSFEGLSHKPFVPHDVSVPPRSRGRPKGTKNRAKSVKIKIQSPGSASVGAGAILKRLRKSKLVGLGRIRSDVSPLEDNHGKRPNSCVAPVDEVLNKVLDRIAFDKSISKQMVFNEGVCDSGKVYGSKSNVPSYCSIDGNDGSFISKPCAPSVVVVEDCNRVSKDKGSGLDVCVDPLLVSNDTSKLNMADEEHGEDESIRKANKDGLDGMNVDSDFVFGDLKRNNVFLIDLLLDGSLNIESFAEKMKKGVEDRELQMKFEPQSVSIQGNGTKRIAISVDDIKKGSEACNVRVYGIDDITKTSAGLFYFKLKNEEGMKVVLESGPWMINNVPLVLNVWEPGIWLEKVEPSTIPIWVCVYGISFELCNGNVLGIIDLMRQKNKRMKQEGLNRQIGKLQDSQLNGNFGRPNVARRGPNQQDRNVRGGFKSQSNGVKDMGIGKASGKEKGNGVVSSMANIVPALKKSPKVLVRGSRSNKQIGDKDEDIIVKNPFQVLEDHEIKDKEDCFLNSVDDEYKNVLDFFYNNYSKYGIEPYLEDDDVESDDEGMVVEMKSGMDIGLNNDLNQNQAIDMIRNGGFSICALLETKLKKKKLSRICSKVLGRWDWISNVASCEGGMGIVVGWDSNAVRVMLHSQTSQIMNVFVEAINGNQKKFCSFVYGHYKEYVRKSLWKDLSLHFLVVKNDHWVLLGDFNVILEPSERSFGYIGITFGMEEFRSCVSKIEVCNLVMFGLQFTWNKSPLSPNGLLKKLDRIMCNMGFLDKFPNANVIFLPFVCSYHAPSILSIPNVVGPKPKPFKFAIFLSLKAEFLPLVKSVWNVKVPGHVMFSLASKIKMLKKPLRKLKFAQGDLAEKVNVLKDRLCKVQEVMVREPFNAEIRAEEVVALKAYISVVKDEELFLKQRSNITWLSEGDFNTKFFHNSMKERRNKGRVEYVEDMDGNSFSGPDVKEQFVKHFMNVLGSREMVAPIHEPASLFINKLSLVDAELMVKHVSLEDIKDVLLCISKIIANRIKGSLNSLVDDCQSAFIPSRQISDNIMLSQELMGNYHRSNGPSKVAFKIDIQKAYDSVDWGFLRQLLMGIIVAILKKILNNSNFKFHWKCEKVSLTHLCFADDLMIFSHGDLNSVKVFKSALDEFSRISGLKPSMEKSMVFFGNVSDHVKAVILGIMPFLVGSLLIKYLGIPLISSRLCKHHCSPFIDKVKLRLLNWKNKSLSFAGRLQLIKSVISSLQVYWSSIFLLPKFVYNEIEKLMRNFLCSQGNFHRGKAKMKWKDVCNLKEQGGLGIKSLHLWNVALMSKHIWNIVSKKDSLWGWRKILLYKDVIREHIVTRIGNGKDTSVWFDNWSFLGPLCKFISNRDIFEAGLSLSCKVADVVCWIKFYGSPEIIEVFPFSVSMVWSDLSIPMPIVPWFKIVWFSQNIPRFAFILWLAINKKLNAQDKFSLKVWKFFKEMMRCGDAPDNLFAFIDYIVSRPIGKSIWSIIQRLVLGSTIYYIWIERNNRLFQRHSRNVDDICSIIKDSMRILQRNDDAEYSLQVLGCSELCVLLIPGGNELCKWEICSLKTRESFCICSYVLDWRSAQSMEMQGDKVYVEVVVSSSMHTTGLQQLFEETARHVPEEEADCCQCGAIPISIASLTQLTYLNLGGNQFTGTIPRSIGSLTNLTELRLGGNNFTGFIPDSIGSLTNLTELRLNENNFIGIIPRSIGSLTKLKNLYLSDNSFYGTIPIEFGNLTNLISFALRNLKSCTVENLDWLSSLSSLNNLLMDGTSLAKSNN
ncbi:putative RNA-directed DNA polymerase [Tanacetum coccineum]